MFRDATRAVKLVAAAMATAEFDVAQLEARAGDGWTTLTELADTLVREHGLPFRTAHAIAAHFVGGRAAPSRIGRSPRCSPTRRPRCSARRSIYTEAQLAHDPEPAALRRGPQDARRSGAGGDRARRRRRRARSSTPTEAWWTGATDALAKAEQTLAERSARAVNANLEPALETRHDP